MKLIETEQKKTLASAIYASMRTEILAGSIAPGEKINIREICDRFSVGLSPVREALSRLAQEGFLQQADNRGFSVSPISGAELTDLTNARCWINELGLRKSILNGPPEWEEQVLIAVHRLNRTPRQTDGAMQGRNPEWEKAHSAFHRSLVSGCGSHWLVDTCERLSDAFLRYRHLARLAGKSRGNAEEEHNEIAKAAVERDANRAVELLNSHFERTAELVREFVEARSAVRVSKAGRNSRRVAR